MTRIILVRHGETEHNVNLVITSGAPGNPLTERGADQARELAGRLKPLAVRALYSSPLLRARQTAEILAQHCGLPVEYLDDLRECDVGELEGRGDEAAFARFDATFEHWYHQDDVDHPLGPGGETGRSAVERVAAAGKAITAAHPEGTVAVVSHGTLLQLAATRLSDNLEPDFGFRRWILNAGTVVLDVEPAGIRCLSWNDVPVEDLLADRILTESALEGGCPPSSDD